jgi:hypothetical protein
METAVAAERLDDTGECAVLPLAEEALRVGKRRVETGRVRVSVSTETEERRLRETLRTERAEVERVAVGREPAEGEQAPAARREEDGTSWCPSSRGPRRGAAARVCARRSGCGSSRPRRPSSSP